MEQGYRQIFKQREFMKMTGANFINRFGDSIDMIAFTWLIFELTGSASWSAIMLGVNMIPNVLVQPFAGAIVERMEKKNIMIACDILRGILTAGIAVLYMLSALQPWMLLLITFLNNTLESFRNPASTAFTPLILEREYYDFGLSFSQSSSRICELIGTGMGGILIAAIGLSGAILFDVASFFLSALIICCIHSKEITEKAEVDIHKSIYLLKEGFRYVKGMPLLIVICACAMLMNMLLVPYNSFQAPYISGILHQGADLLSVSSLALSVGMGIGSFVYPYLHKHMRNRPLLLTGGVSTGFCYLALTQIAHLQGTVVIYCTMAVAAFLFGFCIAILMNIVTISFMKHVEQCYLARVSAIFNASATIATPLTSFAMSVVCLYVSLPVIFASFALFTFVVFTGMIFLKQLKDL